MMRDEITVLMFARYAELFGATAIQVPRFDAATVGALIEHLRRLPGGQALPERPLVAVNQQQASSDRPLVAGDEVALLPPMAGG